jgi:sigma-B regulation protein RsbU (phosphoserine phosphatase)
VVGAHAAYSFSACEHTSGDYVDAFVVPGPRTALLVGDVCGHGLDAALFVFTARALLRTGLSEGGDLASVLRRTNRFLCSDMRDGRFLTLFAALHDPSTGDLSYVNAGHSSPFLVNRSGLRPLERTALPLGISEEARYGPAPSVPFLNGETLFAFTDGLIEARSVQRELFGIERLAALLRASHADSPIQMLTAVRDAALTFAPDAVNDDDMTMLAYRPSVRGTPTESLEMVSADA